MKCVVDMLLCSQHYDEIETNPYCNIRKLSPILMSSISKYPNKNFCGVEDCFNASSASMRIELSLEIK